MAVKDQTFLVQSSAHLLYFQTYRRVLLFVSPCSFPGGMRFAAELEQLKYQRAKRMKLSFLVL